MFLIYKDELGQEVVAPFGSFGATYIVMSAEEKARFKRVQSQLFYLFIFYQSILWYSGSFLSGTPTGMYLAGTSTALCLILPPFFLRSYFHKHFRQGERISKAEPGRISDFLISFHCSNRYAYIFFITCEFVLTGILMIATFGQPSPESIFLCILVLIFATLDGLVFRKNRS
jgi:hypothetical protein